MPKPFPHFPSPSLVDGYLEILATIPPRRCPECGKEGVESNGLPGDERIFKCCAEDGCGHEWGPGTDL